ncbi:hypothetical protein SDC9_177222 [bioreactor metagenome]|uniref:HTH tetR-type domain-containing protein n=1 Tax=bioreactor metagenome TaxID=1076179 RepID=A0A645GVJ3_9ZZZZ
MRAAADLVAQGTQNIRMSDIAEQAGVSLATAYRHFSSTEEALVEYRFNAGMELYAFSVKSDAEGLELIRIVSAHWVGLVLEHGRAMVSSRSHEGYLKRLRSGTRYVSVAADAMAEPIRRAAAALGIPDPGDEGMFLWNILFDPREIFDMIETLGMTAEQVSDRLVATFCAALLGWSGCRPEVVSERLAKIAGPREPSPESQ